MSVDREENGMKTAKVILSKPADRQEGTVSTLLSEDRKVKGCPSIKSTNDGELATTLNPAEENT